MNENKLWLEKGDTVGFYRACIYIEDYYMVGVGISWLEAVNDLLIKINWKFH